MWEPACLHNPASIVAVGAQDGHSRIPGTSMEHGEFCDVPVNGIQIEKREISHGPYRSCFNHMALTVLALNCTLKPSSKDEPSSTDKILSEILTAFARHDAKGEIVRVADHDIKPGVTSDEGPGDAWPALRKRILAADILVMGTPVWLGQPSSVAKRVLERMDAFLGETDKAGRMPSFGRVASVAVVGNEDGAHHISAELYQALADVGFTIPAGGVAYWVGEAMGKVNYADLPKTPDAVADSIAMLTSNAAHLANLLKHKPYPGKADG